LIKLYLAGPLFTRAEQNWLRNLKAEIESLAVSKGKEIDAVWPYELVSQEDLEKMGRQVKNTRSFLCVKNI